MKIEDLQAKDFAEWTDEDKAFFAAYKETDTEAAIKDRLARANKAHTTEMKQLRTELDDAKEAAEAATGGSELEQAQKKIEKLTAKFDEQTKAVESERTARAELERASALKSVDVPWLESVSHKYRETVIAEAFDGVDTEDIGDSAAKIAAGIIESQSEFVRADVKAGAGTQSTTKSAAHTQGTKLTEEKIRGLKGKELIEHFGEAFEAAGNM